MKNSQQSLIHVALRKWLIKLACVGSINAWYSNYSVEFVTIIWRYNDSALFYLCKFLFVYTQLFVIDADYAHAWFMVKRIKQIILEDLIDADRNFVLRLILIANETMYMRYKMQNQTIFFINILSFVLSRDVFIIKNPLSIIIIILFLISWTISSRS